MKSGETTLTVRDCDAEGNQIVFSSVQNRVNLDRQCSIMPGGLRRMPNSSKKRTARSHLISLSPKHTSRTG
eukprot:2966528-Prymnesium_polylepis.1